MLDKAKLFDRRKRRVRYKVKKLARGKPRLSVFRSNAHIYAQVIDDQVGRTLASASTVDKDLKGKIKVSSNKEAASAVGALLAKRAKEAGITGKIAFDRGGYLFHGRVKALAEAALKNGMDF